MVVHIDDKWTDYQRIFYPKYYIIALIIWIIMVIFLLFYLDWSMSIYVNLAAITIVVLPFFGIIWFLKWAAKRSQSVPWKYVNVHIDLIIPRVDMLLDSHTIQYQRYTTSEYAESTGDLNGMKRISQERESYKSFIYELNNGAESIIITEISNSDCDMTRIVIMPYEDDHIEVLDIIKNGIDSLSFSIE